MSTIVSIADAAIYVEEAGQGQGVVCGHGLGGGAYFFSALAESLKDRYRVLSLDMPGHGFSHDPQPFSFQRCAEITAALIESRFAQPVTLVGHSMSAITILKTYALIPDQIDGLIFIGGLPEPHDMAKESLSNRADHIKKVGMIGLGETVVPAVVSQQSLLTMPDKLALYRRLLEANNPDDYAAACLALTQTSAVDVLPQVQVPCLGITGDGDYYATPDRVQAFLAEIPSHTEYVEYARCGHMPFFELPEQFAASVADFLGVIRQ